MSADRSGEAVFGLIDDVGRLTEAADIDAFLRRIVDVYGLATAAYFAMNLPGQEGGPHLAVTYSDEWVEHYKARRFMRHDPVIAVGMSSILPFDWRRLDRKTNQTRLMFGEAHDFGIGAQGVTFPIRGRFGDIALLSVTSQRSDRDWDEELRRIVRDFQILAFHIHDAVLRSRGVGEATVSLAPREIECLLWTSRGKTVWETAMILALSERTVRFYLDIARHKLHGTNITHTVARAIAMGLISGPSAPRRF
jgi:DNA-binding CsgD family transcriptional regulator